MKEVTRFEAFDGETFDTKLECSTHEKRENAIKKTMSELASRPKDSNFSNGDGYVQQDRVKVEKAMIEIVKISGIEQSPEFRKNPFACRHGIIGRYLCDGADSGSCYSAWGRFMCMDEEYREWGQPYFAVHPEERKCKPK